MRKRFLTLLLAATLAGTSVIPVVSEPVSVEAATKKTKSSDQIKADKVAKLIDKIYVQKRTKTTDADCKKAKDAWDKLTTAQKKLVSGEYADPDYFGRNTGDAKKDDPLNQDGIKENELLVVSFGTSFNSSRAKDIGGVEKALQKANPDYSVRRAFTAQIIINHVQARDNEKIDNMDQALNRAVKNKVKNLVVQPTHLMHGAEYDELTEAVNKYKDKFTSVQIAEPLLGGVGKNKKIVNSDKKAVAKAITAQAVKDAGYKSRTAAAKKKVAFVFMGHGTSHKAKVTYDQMQQQMKDLKYSNVFIGTVEGKPADTACQAVIKKVKKTGYKKVVLRPLMVVAGDHANNDMAGSDSDSWKSQFVKKFGKKNVKCQIKGLGRISAIENLYVQHTAAAVKKVPLDTKDPSANSGSAIVVSGGVITANVSAKKTELKNGKYTVKFTIDDGLGMIGLNDALNGKTTLTVKNGKMTVHVPMKGVGLTKAFAGTSKAAGKKGAKMAKRTTAHIDGEDVYAFDIPVKKLNKSFAVSFFSKRNKKWYQKTAKVSYNA